MGGLSRRGIAASEPCRIAGGGMQTLLQHRRGSLFYFPSEQGENIITPASSRSEKKKKECYCHGAAMLFIIAMI